MRRASLLVAGLIAIPTAILVWPQHARPRHHPTLGDERRKAPGIHRAKAAELAVLDRVSRAESAKVLAHRRQRATSVPSTTWVNLGPTDAPRENNYFDIASVDSGRPTTIVVDPRDPNVVYLAVSGGGVWKTFDFGKGNDATWAPTMDALPNLAVGALALDPDHPDTLFAGNGDFMDTAGNTILKSTDGAGTWSDPIALDGVSAIRQIGVHGDHVLVATDVGLFASNDGGATFAKKDLPDPQGVPLAESLWSVVSVGGTSWVAAGVTACAQGVAPPGIYYGSDQDPQDCPAGNNAAFYRSTDDGETWTAGPSTPPRAGPGRTTISACGTTVYAFVGGVFGDHTVGFWRSDDAGATWVNATGTLGNPTLVNQNGDDTCVDVNIGHDQSWYNQAIVVDPSNPDHVLVGGNLCGMRTMNGTSASPTWELVSHWLPGPGYGETSSGRLPYVHADWHTATSVAIGGHVTTFAGTDGGIFSSTNLVDSATAAESVVWQHHNRGLATHLLYSVASGDPADGDGFVAFMGLQDNGTRFRADPANPSAFNQAIGGDGIGATVHHSQSGTTYYASVEFSRAYCKPAEADCSTEVDQPQDDASSHWHALASPLPGIRDEGDEEEYEERARERDERSGEDTEPFLEHYADVETDTTGASVLTHTDEQVFVTVAQGGGFALQAISQDLSNDVNGGGIANVTASRGTPGVYGAAGFVSAEPFYVTTTGNTPSTWTTAQPVHPDGTSNRLTGPASIDFPPVLPPGTQPGQVYVGAFTGTMNDANRTPPPDDRGHLWRTTDFGATWTSIVGADPAHRLPNVPVYVVKYDPVTPTTIYAGTQLGVYLTTDDGATWDRMGDDFPMVPVRDLYVAKNQDFIRAATYGRGLWEIYPSASANRGAPGNGDYDRNLRIDWIDLGAMAARLGETPASTTAPLYSWILDLAGVPLAMIDDDDLAALLPKFGGHP